MGLVSSPWNLADHPRSGVRRHSTHRDNIIDADSGMDSRAQRRSVARKCVPGFELGGFFLYLLNAIIRGVMGYVLIRHPHVGAEGITLLVASLLVVGGLFRTVVASVIQFPTWGWTVFAGICSVVLGFMLLIYWPTASTFFIGLAIGIDLMLDGGALVGFAAAIHSLPKLSPRTS